MIFASARARSCVAKLVLALLATPAWSTTDLIPYSDRPLDAAELFSRVSPSIWLVRTADESGKPLASGSAVVIAPGLAVTNCHVLTKSASVTLHHEAVQFNAQRSASDEARDLCLLTSPELRAPAVTLGHESTLRPGARVFAIGSPRRLELTISDGLLSALRRNAAGELQLVQTSAPISPGSSGGGLFDAHGRLIGITSSGMRDSQNLNFAIPARLVAELAQRSGPVGRIVVIAPAELPQPPTQMEPLIPLPSTVLTPAPAIATATLPAARAARPMDIEYVLEDRLTGLRRKAVYRADGESGGDVVSFNNGGWIEKPGGEVVNVSTSIAGEFDLVMPPGGWGRGTLPREPWQARYVSTTGDRPIKMDLRARIVGDARIKVGSRELDTVQIEYRGFTERSVNSTVNTGAYRADVWYSPELGRPVRFEVLTRGGTMSGAFHVSEKLELVSIR